MCNYRGLIGAVLLAVLLAGCGASSPASCPPYVPIDLSAAEAYAEDDSLPFRFPLDDHSIFSRLHPFSAGFAVYGRTTRGMEYHAAEDILSPAGTPVYAMADGVVSFSGPMGGYGWLVIVDHPDANLYSLYGHLSPSRPKIEPGAVKKGELLGYLGDSDENGGTSEAPMRPHLHFGVRVGQRADYPAAGVWRWQAGWIPACPQDRGWLQPSMVITGQAIPAGGFPGPAGSILELHGLEALLAGIYLFGGVCVVVYATRRDKPTALFAYGAMMLVAGLFFGIRGWWMAYAVFAVAGAVIVLGVYRVTRRRVPPAE